jgi:hypothetical protein
VPACSWDLSLSHDGKDNLTMAKGREEGKRRREEGESVVAVKRKAGRERLRNTLSSLSILGAGLIGSGRASTPSSSPAYRPICGRHYSCSSFSPAKLTTPTRTTRIQQDMDHAIAEGNKPNLGINLSPPLDSRRTVNYLTIHLYLRLPTWPWELHWPECLRRVEAYSNLIDGRIWISNSRPCASGLITVLTAPHVLSGVVLPPLSFLTNLPAGEVAVPGSL